MTRPHYASQAPITPQRSDRGGYDWREDAECRGYVPTLFDAEPKTRREDAPLALAVCAECPVTAACLTDALAHEGSGTYRHGIRGGMTPEERFALYKRRTRKQKGGAA